MTNPVVPPVAPAAPLAAPPPAPATHPSDTGFPAGTPLEQMTEAQQVAYWKHHARKHEDAVKGMGDYQSLKDKANQYDALLASTQTDQERAVEAAKAEGRNAAKAEATPQLVRTEIKAAAAIAGLKDVEALKQLTDRLDTTTFLNDKGEIDAEQVDAYVKSIVPAGPQTPQSVPLGQGRTRTDAKPSVSSGRDLYAEKRGKKTA